jgi:branched-chain amino acid transport system ATP-binding protein
MTMPLLEVSRLRLVFGGIVAVNDVDLEVRRGEVVGLIGPNGAGKTSLFNCITGYYRATAGAIKLDGVLVTANPPYKMSRLGVRRTFQNTRLFGELSVLDNIMAGAHVVRKATAEAMEEIHRACAELAIEESTLARLAGELPHGLQRRIELARALIANPCMLLADEPGAGLNASEKKLIVALLRGAAERRNIGVIVIDHDVGMIARACDRVVVLDHGTVISAGRPQDIRRDPAVVAAYLGKS